MDSWFGKIREKLVVEKVTEEDDDSDEERRRKEEQMKDTLRKLNTDDVLNEDEIARVSTLSTRKPIKKEEATVPAIDIVEKDPSTIVQQTPEQAEAEAPSKNTTISSADIDEPYGSQFWD